MLLSLTLITHLICALVFALVAVLLLATRAQHRHKALLLVACILTVCWSVATGLESAIDPAPRWLQILTVILEQGRSAAWMAVMGNIFFVAYKKTWNPLVAASFLAIVVASMGYVILRVGTDGLQSSSLIPERSGVFAAILIATGGLALVENLFRNSEREARWALKYLCFAIGGLFGYDLILTASVALFGRVDEELFAARGIVDAMMAPLIVVAAARSKNWPIDLHVSRRIVFHSATIFVAGLYLVAMAGVGYYLRLLESPWGVTLRITFGATAALGLVVVLSSASVKARIKNFVARNFFNYRYDYRQEWLNFIGAVSGNPADSSIPERIVRALANLLDCTAGAAWIHVETDATYRESAVWNVTGLPPNVAITDPLPTLLAATQAIIDVPGRRIDESPMTNESLPDWLTSHSRIWIVVPLTHSSGLVGFVALGRPRAPRALNWEDFELLKTAGKQAASYIAEDLAATSLAKARRFEDFNRQFAFVVHDIKNLAGQMSLILKNAERHGDNPRFQKDVLATVADSLARMHALLEQLKWRRPVNAPIGRIDLVALLDRLAEKWRLQIAGLTMELPKSTVETVAELQRLEAVFNHLVQNAADAAGPGGQVKLRLVGESRGNLAAPGSSAALMARIEIIDNGPGMDQTFIREQLFQPMASTKSSGFEIGAYQVMCLVRDMGGSLDVESEVGRGTCMVVKLPIAPPVTASDVRQISMSRLAS